MRKLEKIFPPEKAADGKVTLYHVLSRHSMKNTDPLLLLDAFDSYDPEEYKHGFKMHPHRGIETISYVVSGSMVHKDSLGNEDEVTAGGVQWMTAGSGILHEEMMPSTKWLYGVQLWLNMSAEDKWSDPAYVAIASDEIQEEKFTGGYLRLLAGKYKNLTGYISKHQPVNYYDVHLEAGGSFSLDLDENSSLTLFSLGGEVEINGEILPYFHAASTTTGSNIEIVNKTDKETSTLFFISERIDEPIAWRPGPIVMNTDEELDQAYREIEEGNFLRVDKIEGL